MGETYHGLCFRDERERFENELEAYYGATPLDFMAWERELQEESRRHPEWSPFRRKILGYQFMAERCPVHVFRHVPFFFELNTGRERTDLGTGGLGGWLKREPFGAALCAESAKWWKPCWDTGLSCGWPVLDDNHHTVSYEKVLRLGLRGIIREIEAQQALAASEDEREFLAAARAGHLALIRIAERFAAAAEQQLAGENDPLIRRRLERTAATARRAPAEPVASFHEALNTILILFYVLPSIEGNGISVYGHVDRLLIPYYRSDLEAGRLTPGEARELISYFLAISDARFDSRNNRGGHVGTNTTITLGGCDRDGAPVFNPVTRLFLEQHRDLRLIDPKVNVRVSSAHPEAYVALLAECIASGGNSIALFNDDVIIPANVRMRKAPEDARLYVGGGCQENVLENGEVNSRATIYLNLLSVFLAGFFPEKWSFIFERAGVQPRRYDRCAAFEDLYQVFLANLKIVVDAHIDERNRTEREGVRFNPCPLHSSMLDDCVAKRTDMMAGGCRYNFGSVSLAGIGTLVDSLFAVKTAVFDRQMVTLDSLRRMLETNFEGEAVFRILLAKRVPKFGQEDEAIRAFSARVFADVARVTSGKANSRGGRYEASLFSFRLFTNFGVATGATPDGRAAGDYLSPGMGPSLLALDHGAGIGQVLSALEPLDMTLYPVVAVLDVKLPAVRGRVPAQAIGPVIRRFLKAGGSVLQVNSVDQETLKEARVHPSRHPDLVVRVSGFSSVFVGLAEPIQDEIIARTAVDA